MSRKVISLHCYQCILSPTHCAVVSNTYISQNKLSNVISSITSHRVDHYCFVTVFEIMHVNRTDWVAGSTQIVFCPRMYFCGKSARKIVVPPIESELSFSTGTFLNNYDVRDRKRNLYEQVRLQENVKNERKIILSRLLVLCQGMRVRAQRPYGG